MHEAQTGVTIGTYLSAKPGIAQAYDDPTDLLTIAMAMPHKESSSAISGGNVTKADRLDRAIWEYFQILREKSAAKAHQVAWSAHLKGRLGRAIKDAEKALKALRKDATEITGDISE